MKKKIWAIVNPISGVKAKNSAITQLAKKLSDIATLSIKTTERAAHAAELAHKAINNHVDAVIAIGGDGTVNEVASALVHTQVALGIIPFGSGNGFARHIGIPLTAASAIKKIADFNVQRVDTGLFNNEPFFATAGMGFDAHVAHKFANFGKRGFISYSQVALQEYINYKPKHYTLIIDGLAVHRKAFIVCFANAGQYGNNAWIAPTANLQDGKLRVVFLSSFANHFTPDILFKVFNKSLHKSAFYEEFIAEKITLEKCERFHIDGEPRKKIREQITIQIVPNSLNVIC